MAALLLLGGCAAQSAAPSSEDVPSPSAPEDTAGAPPASLWTGDELPVSADYYRMWAYSASAQTEDPEVLSDLVSAIRALEVGAESQMETTDYTDILTFHFEDGSSLRLEFENQNVVTEDGVRYEVEGLGRLRSILDEMIGEPE